MRASRLLSILTTLQAKGQVTAQALAEELEVSVRTIYRDVDALSAAGIPVYSLQGSGGGYRLLDGYRVRLNGLSPAEAEALFLAGLSRQAEDLGLAGVAASARAKMLAALPEQLRSGAMRARLHIDAPAWFAEAESLDQLPQVAAAVWSQRPIRMHYDSRRGASERRVDPLGIVLKGGAWYLVARDRADIRTFRVSRLKVLDLGEDSFAYPDGFDLETHWAESTRRYEEGLHPNRAVIRLSPRGLAMLSEVLPPYVTAGAKVSDTADAQGWRQVALSVGAYDTAALELLRLGPQVEVLDPPELRAKIAALVRDLSALYCD